MGATDERASTGDDRAVEAANEYLSMIARHQRRVRYVKPKARRISFAEFRQRVRRFRPSTLLPALARVTLAAGEPPLDPALITNSPPWGAALIARESILWGNEFREDSVSGDDLRRLFNAHTSIEEPLNSDGHSLLGLLTRVAYEQFPYQESMFEEVSRTHALMVDGIDQAGLEVLNDPETWMRLLGGSLGEIVGATFLLQVIANQHGGWLDLKVLDHDGLQPIFDKWPRSVIERRAADLSYTFAEFKDAYEAAPKPPAGLERYSYNPLTARPFVRMPDGRLLAPQPRLILRTASPGGLYYTAIAKLGTPFARDLGRLTERYVGELLLATDPGAEIHPEIPYGKPSRMSVDWFLVLPEVVVMFEVKSARYGLLDRAAADGFEERTKTLLDKATTQLERTSAAIDDGVQEFSKIPKDRPRIGIIVTGEPYYLANTPWVRDLLNEASFPTLTASLRDLESLCSLSLVEIGRQLVAIAGDPERSTWNLGDAVDMAAATHRNPVLERAWNSYPWPEGIDDADEEQSAPV